jgi:DNA-binding GntR family transcriptional regulator
MPNDSLHKFEPVDSRTLLESVADSIKRAIFNGNLPPGEQINQAQIANQLGTSRGPVREALRQLEKEGLIKNVPYKGAFVIDISPEYIEELYGIRRALEGFAIECAIKRATPEDLEALENTVMEMRQAAEASNLQLTRELDLQFHRLVCKSAHHNLLIQLWKSLEAGLRLCLAHGHSAYKDPLEIVGTHPDILAAIRSRDAEKAHQLLTEHIQIAGDTIYQSWIDSNRQSFSESSTTGADLK